MKIRFCFFSLLFILLFVQSSFAQDSLAYARLRKLMAEDSARKADSVMLNARARDDKQADSINQADFDKLVAEMKSMKKDAAVDAKASYEILFVTSCTFTEVLTQNKPKKEDDAFLVARQIPGYCHVGLKRVDQTLDMLDKLDPVTLGSKPFMASYGGKYLLVAGEKYYTYIGDQTSRGLYRVYYLRKN